MIQVAVRKDVIQPQQGHVTDEHLFNLLEGSWLTGCW